METFLNTAEDQLGQLVGVDSLVAWQNPKTFGEAEVSSDIIETSWKILSRCLGAAMQGGCFGWFCMHVSDHAHCELQDMR